MEAVKPKLSTSQLREKADACFEKGDEMYSNADIVEFFNTRMKANVSMVHLGRSLNSLGFKRSIIKHQGKTIRCYNLKPKQC